MGIWDFISGTTDSLKRNALNLTAVKNWFPTPGSLKRIAPNVTAVKNVCSTAYGYGSDTVLHIDSAVRGNMNHYLQDKKARSKILHLGKSIVTHAAIEGLKTIPGGFVGYNIVNNSIKGLKDSDKQVVDVKALQADLRRLDKELRKYRKLHEQVPIHKPIVNIYSAVKQKLEDVIRAFMMKEFMGRKPVAPRKK